MREVPLARVRLLDGVRIPRRDGTALVADVFLPRNRARVPALVMRIPYRRSVAQSYWYRAPSWYAERGFAVVVEDVRGRHSSPGRFVPFVDETADGADLVRWVGEQPWCDGNVGTYGYSYAGLSQLLLAGSGEDMPLRAIAPAMPMPGIGEGALHMAGVPAWSFVLGWAAELGGLTLGPKELAGLREVARRPVAELVDRIVPGCEEWVQPWLEQEPQDPYWRSVPDRVAYERVEVPALVIGGWYDIFRRAAFEHAAELSQVGRSPRLVVGPWSHQPALASGDEPGLEPDPQRRRVDDLQLRFFSAALLGQDDEASPVEISILNSQEIWQGDRWPSESGRPERWWLQSDGSANSREGDGRLARDGSAGPPDHLVYDHGAGVPAMGGDDCGDPTVVGMGAADQRTVERRGDVLVYTSPVMAEETWYLGEAVAELLVSAASETSQWLARLCLVMPDGRSVNLVEAVRRVRVTPGEETRVQLDLGPVAFRAGPDERLRLHVTNGSSPRWAGLHGDDVVSRAVVLHDAAHPSFLQLPRSA